MERSVRRTIARLAEMDRERFYDESRIAIVPMGLATLAECPMAATPRRGRSARRCGQPIARRDAGDPFDAAGRRLRVDHVLGKGAMTERVSAFRDYLPRTFPLPHPSWRTTAWERKNRGFRLKHFPPYATPSLTRSSRCRNERGPGIDLRGT